MMTKASRIAILIAALALGLAYVLPVWRIDLEAPQYPEGLGMLIHLNTITGKKPNDLGNINNLNHYIGMKRIEPDSIPELVVMPVVVGVLIVLGVLVATFGRRRLLLGWVGLFLILAGVGLADFWRWEYDYGHDLDEENAIIKIPGMSYQPPLIGSRQILNFEAHSWPASGGWVLIVSALIGVGVAAHEVRRGQRREGATAPARAATPALATLAVLTLQGCGAPGPRPLEAGVDRCAQCLMGVTLDGHGAELVTKTGKVHTFDSVECLIAFLIQEAKGSDPHSVWVTDFAGHDGLVRAEVAHFLVSPTLSSPMGLGITAFGRAADRDGAVNAFGGEPMSWSEVRNHVAQRWPDGSPARGHGGHASTYDPTRAATRGSGT